MARPTFIESRYAPDELVTASRRRRCAGYVFEFWIWFGTSQVLSWIGSELGGIQGGSGSSPGEASPFSPALVLGLLSVAVWGSLLYYYATGLADGQTPGKRLLSMYVLRSDGTRADKQDMTLRFSRIMSPYVVSTFVFLLFAPSPLDGSIGAALGTPATLLLFLAFALSFVTRERQALWDLMSGTYVAYSPNGFMPPTADENGGPEPETKSASAEA